METLQLAIVALVLWCLSTFFSLSLPPSQQSWDGTRLSPLPVCELAQRKAPVPETSVVRALPERFSVTVWNLYKLQREGVYQRLADLQKKSDLLLLQEAVGKPPLEIALRDWRWHLNQAFQVDDLSVGVLTAARLAPSGICGAQQAEPWLGVPKSLLMTDYPIQGSLHPLRVINLHAINFTLGLESYQAQLRQAAELIAAHTGPVLLGGDLNSWSQERQQALRTLADELGLRPVVFTEDTRTRVFGNPLDGIWIRGLTVLQTRVIHTPSSDHNALHATLTLSR